MLQCDAVIELETMKRILLFFIGASCVAQCLPQFDPRVSTMGSCPACSSDGRFWQHLTTPPGTKFSYILGISEGVTFVGSLFQRNVYFPNSLSSDEFIKAIDKFYDQPENLPIPIMQAMRMVTARVNGADPVAIEKEIATLRRDALELHRALERNKQ